MCCLFGFHDYGHNLTRKQRALLLRTLSVACEERGTDATGIAYNEDGRLRIYKRPLPAHKMWFRVSPEATAVMGHTRMTTQGSEKYNQNNHPFHGKAAGQTFALAHNGMLSNDRYLRKKYNLPASRIETDSYVAVQLLEHFGPLDFSGFQHIAEQLEGSFTLTALSEKDDLYFIKGNNPMCIYHFKGLGLYVYASTEQILQTALVQLPFLCGKVEPITLHCGDMLCIDALGNMTRSTFNTSRIDYISLPLGRPYGNPWYTDLDTEEDYISDLKAVAACYGLYEDDIDELLQMGISPEEIEEYLYCG